MIETASELRAAGNPVRLSVGYATAAFVFKF
jgi:hypothetical protein